MTLVRALRTLTVADIPAETLVYVLRLLVVTARGENAGFGEPQLAQFGLVPHLSLLEHLARIENPCGIAFGKRGIGKTSLCTADRLGFGGAAAQTQERIGRLTIELFGIGQRRKALQPPNGIVVVLHVAKRGKLRDSTLAVALLSAALARK